MLNQITIIGRLVAAPELKSLPSGVKYTKIRIACDRDYSKGEDKKADFINCVAWRSTAEFIARNFGKGQMIALIGRLQIDEYKTREGENRREAVISVDSAYFAGGGERKAAEQTQGLQELESDERPPWEEDDNDLPM